VCALLASCALLALSVSIDMPPSALLIRYGLVGSSVRNGRVENFDGIEFIEVHPGYFRMGSHDLCTPDSFLDRILLMFQLSPARRSSHISPECPPHWVEIPRAFWMARTEVTNAQYERFRPCYVRPTCSSFASGPAVNMTWMDAREFCIWMSRRTARNVRLPTEAEWEFACRGGATGAFSFGNDPSELGAFAWFEDNSRGQAQRVATRQPNPLGLYDMHGNASEWCIDSSHDDYVGAPSNGRPWLRTHSPNRVYRGGSWCDPADLCRSADVEALGQSQSRDFLGFRPVVDGDLHIADQ
jgi:formylglycine-generating enzyme required for sulfatase activity